MSNDKKYYKALLKEPYMQSRKGSMQYELGKNYKISGELKICENGFHYTDNIHMLSLWYYVGTYDIFEVIPSGKTEVIKSGRNYCSEEIRIIRKLDDAEILKLYEDSADELLNSGIIIQQAALARVTPFSDYLELLLRDKCNIRVINEIVLREMNEDIDVLKNHLTYDVVRAIIGIGRPYNFERFRDSDDPKIRVMVEKLISTKNGIRLGGNV